MSRLSKFLMVFALIIFALACSLVSQPVQDVQNLAGTAEALASSMPAETLAALASQIPIETLQALPSAFPGIETALPDIENFFDPQGTPVSEWNGIPIMSQATAGQEFNANTYSFRASVTVQQAYDFYDEQMISLGWSQSLGMPANDAGGLLLFSKEDALLTITITAMEGSTVVLLATT